ncbi:MAG: hypothetical protein FH749_00410 [Firmicutes bacterium]|nr:hypothetical protein [Bacillota bacterium]
MAVNKRLLKRAFTVAALMLAVFVAAGTIYFIYTYQSIDLGRELERPSILLDRDGNEIGRFATEIRTVVSLDEMSPDLINAFIAVEDSRFYQHFGLDVWGIGRALWRNLQGRRVVEGGSTITQQLAKNEYFIDTTGAARTLQRKIREAVYAIKLEQTFTKDEILERYMNRIYFDHGRFGVEAAAQYYFGKSASELSLAESALLAGIPRGPALYSLRRNPERSNERKNVVLARMAEYGYITEAERAEAAAITLEAAPLQERTIRANHFRQRVEAEARTVLAERYPGLEDKELTNLIYNQGLQITTTLSLQMQIAAEQVITERGEQLLEQDERVQAALVAIDSETGGIAAIVESIDLTGDFPRATRNYRLGSAYKGVLYAAALETGYTAATTVECQQTEFTRPGNATPYVPIDWNNQYHNRPLRIREALVDSCNVVAVKVHQAIGTETIHEMARRLNPQLGDRDLDQNTGNLQTPLSPTSTIMDLTLSYVPLGNGGYSVTPYTIEEIRDQNGLVLYQASPQREPVIDPRVAYITTNMLQDVRGAGGLPFATAGKTGTNQSPNNLVFVGLTSDVVASVFFGFDSNIETTLGDSVTIAAPAWREFISRSYQDSPPPGFSRPPGIDEAIICLDSGQLATPNCPETHNELFLPGTVPTRRCEIHTANIIEICTSTWLLANPYCPDNLRRQVPRDSVWNPTNTCWFHGPDTPGDGQQPPGDGEEDGENDDENDEGNGDEENDLDNNNEND